MISFSRRPLLAAASLVLAASVVSVQGSRLDAAGPNPAPKPLKPASCGTDFTATSITVSDTWASTDPLPAPTGNDYKISSDGKGAYVKGGKGTSATTLNFQISNCSYDFTGNLGARRIVAELAGGIQKIWFFNVDHLASVPVTGTAAAVDPAYTTYCTKLYPAETDNYAGCGFDADGRPFVRRAMGFTLDTSGATVDHVRFNVSPLDGGSSTCGANNKVGCTNFVRVYHPDANTWVLAADAPFNALSVINNVETAETLPFMMVVKK